VAIRASLRRRDPFVGDGLGASSADAAIGEPASGRLDGSGHTGLQAEERDRIVELGAPAAADQHDIAGADLDAGRAFGAGQVVRRDPVAGGQDVGAVQGGDVQQHAAADHRLELVYSEHGEPAAGLRLGGRDATVEPALVGHVTEGVDVRTGVAAGDDQVAGVRTAVRANRVAVAAEQNMMEGGGVRGVGRGLGKGLREVEDLDAPLEHSE